MRDFSARSGEGVQQFRSYMYGMEMQEPTQETIENIGLIGGGRGDDTDSAIPLQSVNDAVKTAQSSAIPISQARVNHFSGKYTPNIAIDGIQKGISPGGSHFGGLAIAEMLTDSLSGNYFGHSAKTTTPATITKFDTANNAATVHMLSRAINVPFVTSDNYGQSMPLDDIPFSPQSPPTSCSLTMLGNRHHPITSASPRSFNESIFSFRAGSLTSAEQQTEKQKKRKENHNAVERRRRDLINGMITQLSLLVSAGPSGLEPATAAKMNKGEVLEASVKRMLLLNQALLDISKELASLNQSSEALQNYSELLATLVTLPSLGISSKTADSCFMDLIDFTQE